MGTIKLKSLFKLTIPKLKTNVFKPASKSRLVDGIVTTINDEFRVLVNIPLCEENNYDRLCLPLTDKSLNLKGKTVIFSKTKDKHGKYTKYYRSESEAIINPGSSELYNSVANDQVVTGYIIRYSNRMEFELVACHGRGNWLTPYETESNKPLFNVKKK